MKLGQWVLKRFFAQAVDARVRQAVEARDDGYWRPLAAADGTARQWHEVREQLQEIAALCRENPLAARLVGMTTDFVIGSGAHLEGPPFAQRFWHHPLNHMDTRIYAWCRELSRAGELFIVLSRNAVDGMSYVREIPALQIDRIDTHPQDRERELRYHQLTDDVEGRWWPSAEGTEGQSQEADQVVLHYAINRPVGEVRGTSDLAQIAVWLKRYDFWLEDRVRINRYKSAYLWHVKIDGALPGTLEAKRSQYSTPPSPGSIIVTDGSEEWEAVQPRIDAGDAEADGKALRLMIAAGAGVPLHFLAEGESATRATAREMGIPTYRHFAHRQYVFARLLEDVIETAARRAGQEIEVEVAFESVGE